MSKQATPATTVKRRQDVLRLFQSGLMLTSRAIARQIGASETAIRVDIDFLRKQGHNIEASPGAGGGYRLRRKKRALCPAGENRKGD